MRTRFFFFLLVQLTVFPLGSQAQPEPFIAGTHYEVLDTPVRTSSADRLEVTEFFWYGCPACFQFDPVLEHWVAELPEDVIFSRLPAFGGRLRDSHAQAYYAALALDRSAELHSAIFNAIHLQGERLGDPDDIRQLFGEHGISKKDFDTTWSSFGVDNAMKKGMSQLRQYGSELQSTPSLIVNGRYVVVNQQDVLEIVDFLLDMERDRR